MPTLFGQPIKNPASLASKARCQLMVSAPIDAAQRINGFCIENRISRSKLMLEAVLREIERRELAA
ncbi:MAG: hypothetical protein WCC90_17270 [Methylocella sp.]